MRFSLNKTSIHHFLAKGDESVWVSVSCMAFPCYLQTPLKAYLQSFYSSWPSNALDLQNPVFQPNTENITFMVEMLEVSLLFLFCQEVYWETFGAGQWWQQQQEGHGLLMLFNIITVSVFCFFFPCLCVDVCGGMCVSWWVFVCCSRWLITDR